MKHFDIRVDFRGKRIDGHVQDFGEYLIVTFSDNDVLKEYGGAFKISSDLKTFSHHYHPEDEKRFHAAIVHELKRIQ